MQLPLFDWDRREPGKHCMWKEISGLLVDPGWKALKITLGDSKLKMYLPRMGRRGQTGVKFFAVMKGQSQAINRIEKNFIAR